MILMMDLHVSLFSGTGTCMLIVGFCNVETGIMVKMLAYYKFISAGGGRLVTVARTDPCKLYSHRRSRN